MTREEAIYILSTRDAHGVLCGYTSGVTEALDMAIEALQFSKHFDLLKEYQSLQEVVRCKDCSIRYTSCPMVVRQGGMFTFFTKDDDYCSYGVAKGESDGT